MNLNHLFFYIVYMCQMFFLKNLSMHSIVPNETVGGWALAVALCVCVSDRWPSISMLCLFSNTRPL